jgi:LemA protein
MEYVALALLALVLTVAIAGYNRLVRLRERFRNAFAQIDVQLKRRYDLIPNLVETAKGYMKHEREALQAVIAARNRAMQAGQQAAASPGAPAAMVGLVAAEQSLGGALTHLFGLAEAYPDLKANQTMLRLQEELATTENRIAFARQAFNDAVMRYNEAIASVPTNLVAMSFRFGPAEFFRLDDDAERAAPRASFG